MRNSINLHTPERHQTSFLILNISASVGRYLMAMVILMSLSIDLNTESWKRQDICMESHNIFSSPEFVNLLLPRVRIL